MSRREEESGALDCEQASTDAEGASAASDAQTLVSSIATGPSFIVGIGASAGSKRSLR
jgi:hypothetical protein